MAHSNQVREFLLSDEGIDLVDVYVGADRVLTGVARVAHETQERAASEMRRQDHQRKLLRLAGKRKAIEEQIAALEVKAGSEAAQETLQQKTAQQNTKTTVQPRTGANGQAKEEQSPI